MPPNTLTVDVNGHETTFQSANGDDPHLNDRLAACIRMMKAGGAKGRVENATAIKYLVSYAMDALEPEWLPYYIALQAGAAAEAESLRRQEVEE